MSNAVMIVLVVLGNLKCYSIPELEFCLRTMESFVKASVLVKP